MGTGSAFSIIPFNHSLIILLGDGLGGFTRTTVIRRDDDPGFIAVGDFNADGFADLAVANTGDQIEGPLGNTVSILLGDGRGGFVPMPDIEVEEGPAAIAVADLDDASRYRSPGRRSCSARPAPGSP